MNKRMIIDILIIFGTAVIFGLIYNSINPKGVGYIYMPKKAPALADSTLFGVVKSSDSVGTTPMSSAKSDSNSIAQKRPDTAVSAPNETQSDNLSYTVTYEQMKKIVGNDNFYIIDARSPEIFAESNIKGSHNIFPYMENTGEYMRLIFSAPRDKRIVIYCDGGNCDLSHKVAEDMKTAGYTNIFIYSGGWNEWKSKESKK